MKSTRATQEPRWVRYSLMSIGLGFLFFFLGLPLLAVFVEALAQGVPLYIEALKEPETRSAIWLTIGIALAVLPFNIVFGVAAAWAIAKFEFKGKSLLITLIDLPFAVSPVVAGLIFILLFGSQGTFGPWLSEHDIKIIFAVPGMILATLFITFPFIARELIPLMQAQGKDEEEAAVSLHVEILYNEYNAIGAFAAASILALLALVTLVAKTIVEWRMKKETEMLSTVLAPEKT